MATQSRTANSCFSPSCQEGREIITVLQPNDVLMGRGAIPTENEGNRRLRNLVVDHHKAYAGSNKHKTKQQIIWAIVGTVQARGGRFLRRVEPCEYNGEYSNEVPARWIAIHDQTVIMDKVKQLMRDVGPETRLKRKLRKRKVRPVECQHDDEGNSNQDPTVVDAPLSKKGYMKEPPQVDVPSNPPSTTVTSGEQSAENSLERGTKEINFVDTANLNLLSKKDHSEAPGASLMTTTTATILDGQVPTGWRQLHNTWQTPLSFRIPVPHYGALHVSSPNHLFGAADQNPNSLMALAYIAELHRLQQGQEQGQPSSYSYHGGRQNDQTNQGKSC